MSGRPTKLTKELQARIVSLIAGGNYPEAAAGACDVARRTFFEWLQRGLGEHPTRKPTAARSAFAREVMTAIDKSECRLVLKLAEFEEGTRPSKRNTARRAKSRITMSSAMSMQWKLSRRFPERWGQRPAVAMNVGILGGAQEAEEQDARPVINVIIKRDDDDEPGASMPLEEYQPRGTLLAAPHPYPEELGADLARSRHAR